MDQARIYRVLCCLVRDVAELEVALGLRDDADEGVRARADKLAPRFGIEAGCAPIDDPLEELAKEFTDERGEPVDPDVIKQRIADFDARLDQIEAGEQGSIDKQESMLMDVASAIHEACFYRTLRAGVTLTELACLRGAIADAVPRADAEPPLLWAQGRVDRVEWSELPDAMVAQAVREGRGGEVDLAMAVAPLLEAADALWLACGQGATSRVLLPNTAAVRDALAQARASLDARLCSAYQGAITASIAATTADVADFLDPRDLMDRLAADRRACSRTPLLGALGSPGAFGPHEPVAEEEAGDPLQAPDAIACVRFAAPPSVAPLVRLLVDRDSGIRWHILIAINTYLTRQRGLAVIRSEEVDFILGDPIEICDGLASISDLHVPALSVAFSTAPRSARLGERLASAHAALAELPPGQSVVLGVPVHSTQIARQLQMGRELKSLARAEPLAMRALAAAASEVAAPDTPVGRLDRMRAQVQSLASRLGVASRDSAGDGDDAELRGLHRLIREFPRWFDSGAARLPLHYAVLSASRVEPEHAHDLMGLMETER